jgi:mevalonate kinase
MLTDACLPVAIQAAGRASINAWAYCGECVVHGKPSGLDNTISVYGGAVKFAKGSFTMLSGYAGASRLLCALRLS